MSKSLLSSKTFWFNLLTGIVTVAGDASGIIPFAYTPYITGVVGVANILLRLITTQPVTVPGMSAPIVAPPITPEVMKS